MISFEAEDDDADLMFFMSPLQRRQLRSSIAVASSPGKVTSEGSNIRSSSSMGSFKEASGSTRRPADATSSGNAAGLLSSSLSGSIRHRKAEAPPVAQPTQIPASPSSHTQFTQESSTPLTALQRRSSIPMLHPGAIADATVNLNSSAQLASPASQMSIPELPEEARGREPPAQNVPPEGVFLTGGAGGGPAEYQHYAPPPRWIGTTRNARERRVDLRRPGDEPLIGVVGEVPVLWTQDVRMSPDRRTLLTESTQLHNTGSRSAVLEQRIHQMTSPAPLDAAILQLVARAPGQHVPSPSADGSPVPSYHHLQTSPQRQLFLSATSEGHHLGSVATPQPQQQEAVYSVRQFYSESDVTPFRRVHVHREDQPSLMDFSRSSNGPEGKRKGQNQLGPLASDVTVDSRHVWGPKNERRYEGVYRSWWQ